MSKIKLLLSYDGTDFCGWQKQKEHATASPLPSIQETLEGALGKIFQHKISVVGSGRTDAGVHALAQVAHFSTDKVVPKDICWALRAHLPQSIVAKKAWLAPQEFHANLKVDSKTYRYWVWNQPRGTALLNRYSWWIRRPLDIGYLNEVSSYLVKQQDFKSFQTQGTNVPHTVREIFKAEWKKKGGGMLEFEISGDGFLKQMVRNIVGTLVEMDLRRESPEKMLKIIAARDRTRAGGTAPPNGLFLCKVYYPKMLDNKCRQI